MILDWFLVDSWFIILSWFLVDCITEFEIELMMIEQFPSLFIQPKAINIDRYKFIKISTRAVKFFPQSKSWMFSLLPENVIKLTMYKLKKEFEQQSNRQYQDQQLTMTVITWESLGEMMISLVRSFTIILMNFCRGFYVHVAPLNELSHFLLA